MVYHFHDMIDMLVDCGYKKGTTLFGYGYDFRQSNRIDKVMVGLRVKLETAYKASGGKKIFAKYVNKWICIACPFQGAPGCINDSLLTGLQFVYGFESFFFVSRWVMHQLLVECPSIYEMLPNPHFKWKEAPIVQVWRKNPEKDGMVELVLYEATDCVSLFEEALKNNELKYNGKTIALPFNMSIFKWATETRQILDNAELPDTVSFYNIYGTSYDTPYDVCYGSESSPVGDLSEVCHTMPVYTYVGGDGTVPIESAAADGFAAKERVGIEADHRGLLCDENVLELLKKWLGLNEMKSTRRRLSKSKVMDFVPEGSSFENGKGNPPPPATALTSRGRRRPRPSESIRKHCLPQMKHIFKIIAMLVAISATWIGLLETSTLPRSYTWLLPIYLVVALGCYGLFMVGFGLMFFPMCPQEAVALQKDIVEAKEFLSKKGVDVGSE
ncbi:hypothetical protein GUJ93_ZPchr0002g25888 [Zizania palustris]|uniref:Dolichol-phosphate mannose synthase subunit 3 n=1 Tax=Zizania palustris TaxID=103762 RepID=A0A8J5VF25_ZIZPA|nr:hypothetical protein GUJ93_ZPchr0002g25888 [Zizania palustris]